MSELSDEPLTETQRDAFFEELIETGSVVQAAYRAGISAEQARYSRFLDEAFGDEWTHAEDAELEQLIAIARLRAHHGVERPLVTRGAVVRHPDGSVETVREFNDKLLMFLIGMEG